MKEHNIPKNNLINHKILQKLNLPEEQPSPVPGNPDELLDQMSTDNESGVLVQYEVQDLTPGTMVVEEEFLPIIFNNEFNGHDESSA